MIINSIFHKMIKYYSGDPKRIQHFTKVHAYAKLIAELENLEESTKDIIELSALVHDIGIKKAETLYGTSTGKLQEKLGPAEAEILLNRLNIKQEVISRVCYLIAHHHTYDNIDGIDYQILIEADFLVNAYEDNLSKSAITAFSSKYFKTEAGKQLLQEMFEV